MSTDPLPDGVRLDVLFTAEIPTPRGYVFRAQGNAVSRLRAGLTTSGGSLPSPCLAFVVRHPSAGVVLIDTGMHPDASRDLRRDFGLPMSLLFRSLKPAPDSFAEQLRRVGVAAEEVKQVVMTHLHVDHTSGMRLLPKATFICTREEWAAAQSRFATARGYASHHRQSLRSLKAFAASEPTAILVPTHDPEAWHQLR